MTTLGEAIDRTALGWVKPELDALLDQARREVEAHAQSPGDAGAMATCVQLLQQVRGSLQMLDLDAAELVAGELQHLALALQRSEVADPEIAGAALMRGLVQLPDYLEYLQGGNRDLPLVLLPLLDELRDARGAGGYDQARLAEMGDAKPVSEAELSHARAALGGRNRALMRTVAAAVKEDLMQVKDALDLHLRGSQRGVDTLQPQASALGRIADTLTMIGLDGASSRIAAHRDALAAIAAGQRPASEDALLDIAGTLLQVDGSLDEVARIGRRGGAAADDALASESRKVTAVLLHETGSNMARVRESVVAAIQAGWHPAALADAPRLLHEVGGALRMLDQPQPADLVTGLQAYVQSELLTRADKPDDNTLDRFADAVSGLEMYLEGLGEGARREDSGSGPGQALLDIARTSLAALGYWPPPQSAVQARFDERPEQDDIAVETEPAMSVGPSLLGPATAPEAPAESEVESEAADTAAPPSEEAVAATPAAAIGFEHTGEEIDDEIRDVFLEEFEEEIGNLSALLPPWRAEPGNMELLRPIRRVFHTLKGSGRLVGARVLGEFSWKIEHMLNRVLDGSRPASPSVVALVEQAHATLPQLRAALRGEGAVATDLEALQQVADRVAAGEEVRFGPAVHAETASTPESVEPQAESPAKTAVAGAEAAEGFDAEVVEVVEPASESVSVEPISGSVAEITEPEATEPEPTDAPAGIPAPVDPVLLEILDAEVSGHLQTIEHWLRDSAPRANEGLLRALHTSNGAFAMTEVPAITDTLGPAEGYVKRLITSDRPATPEGIEAITAVATALHDTLHVLRSPNPRVHPTPELAARLQALRDALPDPAAQPEPADGDHLDALGLGSLPMPETIEPLASAPVDPLLHGDAGLASALAEADHSAADRAEAEYRAAQAAEAAVLEAERIAFERAEAARIEQAQRFEAERLEAERAEAGRLEAARVETERLEAARLEADRVAAEQAETRRLAAEQAEAERQARREQAEAARAAALLATAASAASPDDPDEALDLTGLDPDLVDLFVEEARDLLDHADGLLARLRDAPDAREPIGGLQRDLHTIKGAARMAGVMAVGELGHAMESLLELVAAQQTELGHGDIPLLERGFDRLHGMITRVGGRRAIGVPAALIAEFGARTRGAGEDADADKPKYELKPLSAPIATDFDTDEDDLGVRAPQEQVRIRADLLDRLVNYAGEVAIYRARLEQQLGAFRAATGEMEQTNTRLRDQLRRLDAETEAQIIARHQREHAAADPTFDPLELDRYSTLQQLSRGLAESAADLASLQGTLDELTRQYDTLLLQQSRVSSDLQQGLMRTRMVPFDALVPRLRRVVRQAAADTGKSAQLRLDNAQGELDRNVLERMTAPLEHMLRNAVAHGLESPDARKAANKPEEGTVHIAVRREGSEVVLEVGDDGAGLDRAAIRRRAEERGLVRNDAVLADGDLDMLILEPGFSTAVDVSRLAGRGVGMDVVASEVRQLGGALDIHSRAGEGTTFTLRLPQTLAVTQAVFVRIGETSFAVPIASVRGVGRIARSELSNPDATYRYGGEDYALHDLGRLLGQAPARAEGQVQMPLLLIRSGDLRAAVCIDQVLGNREIVVKPVGPQVASIPGIFGATIMGDGSVVVILDVAPLVRRSAALAVGAVGATEVATTPHTEPEQRRIPLVMVVDDSITMRKVTARVLERHNYEVMSARDGIDALERMDERIPDLVLLDIEMPRMDGYELAMRMRDDLRLRHVPIIMITSRTGEKHRQRAFELGVRRYLGKPYQEPELMRNVFDLLGTGPVHDDGE